MNRNVIYTATDPKVGMTPQELRDALRHALTLDQVWIGGLGHRRIVKIQVTETDPGARIEGND